ncbi:HlyD family efflux transporter periplasmic adaptor subunit [Mucilaginibacter paludis]|nr:HlyD family efflux transporter periplasmic adaptor subunit [Mucilaginibacter paludis]
MILSQERSETERSEPVQDIIDRMPNKFGYWVTGIVLVLVILLLSFGMIIQYPDTVTGTIIINAKYAPVKLVANTSGKLVELNYQLKEFVKEGDYIAVIQNPSNTRDMIKVRDLVESFNIKGSYQHAFSKFPGNLSLGDVNVKYYAFLNALHKIYDYNVGNVYLKQQEGLQQQIQQSTYLLETYGKLKATRERNMMLSKKIANRDSILFSQKAATEEDFDRSNISFLSSKENYQSIVTDINSTEETISTDQNKLQQLSIQKDDEESQMNLDVLTSYGDLKDAIKAWEQKFVFKSPMSGILEFSKFWTKNQFVQSGEDVFTVVPDKNHIIGQVDLPANGAGKVKIGQKVIIKLDNYPFEEYGSVSGLVSSISLTKSKMKVNQDDVDIYLVEVTLPNGLTTNYKSNLEFKYEIKGTADIVSNERSLLSRFFDNLKYVTNKN